MNLDLITITCSVLLQALAMFMAVRLMLLTKTRILAILIFFTAFLMVARRFVPLYRLLTEKTFKIDTVTESLALVIALLFVAMVLYVTRIAQSLKIADASVTESEAQYRDLVETSQDLIWKCDAEGKYVYLNPAWEDVFGYKVSDMIGRKFSDFQSREYAERDTGEFKRLIHGNITKGYETVHIGKDGRPIHLVFNAKAYYDKEGKVAGTIGTAYDITERVKMEDEIREKSIRDPLTGLYNRRGLVILLEQQLKAAKRTKGAIQLTYVDCDDMKLINDTLGHEEGDNALLDTAGILRQTFRESDIIARMGGDEFAVLTIDSEMSPDFISARLQQNIDNYNAKGLRPYKVAMSWGTAIHDSESPPPLENLISSADEKMYENKKSKSNKRI